jgi:putative transposase
MKSEHPIRLQCQALNVALSGYYDWRQRQQHPSPRAVENAQLRTAILQVFQASRQTYGSPRIQQSLAQSGRSHGRNRIARLMRQQHLCGRAKPRFRVQTTDSNHDQPVAPNRLAQAPAPEAANRVWVADMTYIPTDEGWLYLAGIMDLFSRKIVGWAMNQCIDTQLVLASWNMAANHRHPANQLLFHSDRGCQYASAQFRNALQQVNALPSMSRRANCYDNAAMESFWSTLKHELVYRSHFRTRAQARSAIFDYIEVFYNRCRLHSSLNYRSPVDFETQNN